ncbi:unnamed protein product [Microthlaspi erraticum]|uniref:Retrotransposon gag domain-containing protein n=1 Tax=Microthlaspi erraticum TaxID=1685480 RepID=A0A6D2L7L5_9BRAS|nr:unnamed protein product [Microthlaspi erraticum]
MKQTLAATSSNHAEILAIHEASRECIWLRSVVNTFEKIVVYRQEKELQRLCMKIMLLASHNSRMGTLKETERSTSYRSFSSPMSYRRMAMKSPLGKEALPWFSILPSESINNFNELTRVFVKHYSMNMVKSGKNLSTLIQERGEPLHAFIERF